MKAHPEKFQATAIGKQTKKENITFNLENNEIKCEDSVKLLGETSDFQLNFNIDISNICTKKGIKTVKCFKKDWQALVRTEKTKYLSFIYRSNFNYSPLTRHFCGETNTKKIKKKSREGIGIYKQ